ncbi:MULTISPECIES: hypothetical protein [Lactiplantibacillus]|jgi:hypothetical protein|uniref:hypothetical protein n=1 Tax=Lactiplantibacillus TaxID=2767842 RepID=UPI001CDAA910|nr:MULTISPECIES: hypothetical protein [Lactiplantibacillus]MCM8607757.1 hypothetical protein [Lactiplantibacillus sp. B652]USJ87733.1 hypothetical protein KSF55_07965 [Lactiplantibacillus pentosus]
MAFSLKLPRNRYESSWFILIISVISVNVIAPLITCFDVGFSWRTWQQTLTVLPMIWVVVVALVLLTHRPAEQVTRKILARDDSFRANMIVNCLVNVFMMSIILTVVASWIGTRTISWLPVQQFFYKWSRNF